MTTSDVSLGELIRRLRLGKQFTLRKFAQALDISPTYLSQIERDEVLRPPGEELLVRIATALDQDPNALLALAGRVPSDLTDILAEAPAEAAAFLRTARDLTPDQWKTLKKKAEDLQKSKKP